MKSLIYIVFIGYALLLHGSIAIEQSMHANENSTIFVKKILINFLTEYLFNQNTFVSFVVSQDQETPFQRDLLDALFSDPALVATTKYVLTKLSNGLGHRKKISYVILIKSSEALEWVYHRQTIERQLNQSNSNFEYIFS